MRRAIWLVPLLVGACTEGTEGVLRNCDTSEGTICPYAGAGKNGWNGDAHDKLDVWFSYPMSITFSPYGKPVIADWNNHKLRQINDDGTLTTIMGTDFLGDGDPDELDRTEAGAPGTTVNLNHPTQQQYFPDGTLLSASWHTHKLRTWDPTSGIVHVWAGGAPGFDKVGEEEDPDAFHDAALAQFNQPKEVLIKDDGNVFVLDMRNQRVRELMVDDWQIGTISGTGEKGYCGEGVAEDICWNFPQNANPEPGGALALDEANQLMYVADTENAVIRVIDLVNDTTSLLAGKPGEEGDAVGAAADARFHWPSDLVLDGDQLFVADADNHKIKVIDLPTGNVSVFAGTGEPSCEVPGDVAIPEVCDNQADGGDGGPATEATLYRPFGVDLDLDGNLVIADSYDHRFRIVYR
ncbi:MAG: hypothetical protein H6733_01475 [Alphaproteobacteria bacterium]|nr:hypothetical protein [Alphaproteobacteria bacterium]